MKKIISLILALSLAVLSCLAFGSCAPAADYTVGICQLAVHPSLDQATEGFKAAVTEKLNEAGKTVVFDTQIPGEANLCSTVITTFIAKNVNLIMANATPALVAAANATTTIPILGTSVTDYDSTFQDGIPENVSGTSDAVPFDQQAQMMIDTLGLVAGDNVGVIYCSNETNSKFQYDAVSAYFATKDINVTAYTFSETNELQSISEAAAAASKAIFIPSDNTVAKADSIVSAAANAADVPVFTSYGGEICYCSLAIDYYQLGYETGVMAAEILLGTKSVSDIEIKTLVPTVDYNEELCEALGIQIPSED